jgi:hypothetical protein
MNAEPVPLEIALDYVGRWLQCDADSGTAKGLQSMKPGTCA